MHPWPTLVSPVVFSSDSECSLWPENVKDDYYYISIISQRAQVRYTDLYVLPPPPNGGGGRFFGPLGGADLDQKMAILGTFGPGAKFFVALGLGGGGQPQPLVQVWVHDLTLTTLKGRSISVAQAWIRSVCDVLFIGFCSRE